MDKITIIGDGAMGTICAMMLAQNGHSVRLWSAFPAAARQLQLTRENKFLPGPKLDVSIEITSQDSAVFDDRDWVISAVPTQFIRVVWQRLKQYCPSTMPICSVTKGIENGSLLRPSGVLLETLDEKPDASGRSIAVLSGPSIAPEIARQLPATVAIAASDNDFALRVQQAISTPYFRAYTNPDMVGVEVAGAAKNVIAIAAGILDGMRAGDNAKAALLARGLAEITRLGLAMGAIAETFAGLAGVGDLVTTCISPVGRNRSFGQAVGEGKTVEEALGMTESVVEGVATTQSIVELAKKLNVEMPITDAVYNVLFKQQDRSAAIADLMNRPLRCEVHGD